MPLKLLSFNCRGLHKNLKRKLIFSKCKQYDIICLQETFITEDDYKKWKLEWDGQLIYYRGSNHSNGLIILINNSLKLENEVKIIHSEEKIIGIEITFFEMKYVIINIYAPHKKREKVVFYNKLYNLLNKFTSNITEENIIICGDFNSVLNNSLDIIAGAPHDIGEIDLFVSFLSHFDLIDIWRSFNKNAKDFTWFRNNPFIARRLDYFICNKATFLKTTKVNHIYMSCSDHKAIFLEIKTEQFKRGPGIWKFNDDLLNDKCYLKEINNFIDVFLLSNTNKDPCLQWELLKNEIKAQTIQYCNLKNQNRFSETKELLNEINKVNELITVNPQSQHLQEKLKILQQKMEIITMHKTRGTQVRSKVKFIEEGERNTRYFLGMEKSRGDQNTIHELKLNNSTIINPLDILHEIKLYYTKLYAKDVHVDDSFNSLEDYLKNIDYPKLSNEESLSCESVLDTQALSNALSELNGDSSPGSDGLTVPFYKVFWGKLKTILFDSLNTSIDRGELSVSQKRGIFTLLHKGEDLDRNNLGNWRPISLLNTDYKIFSKVIAMRLQSVIGTLIHINQKGFIKGRSISELIRIIDDSILATSHNHISGLLVSVDFCKAFDSVSKNAIINTLKCLNFGPSMIKFVSVLINNSESCVRNYNWFSSFFPCEKGVRQGCCASPYLFLLVAELLSIKLRHSKEIKGISITNKNFQLQKILQYADDTSLFLKDENELTCAFNIIDNFGAISGLKLNRHKSSILPLGGFIAEITNSCNAKWLQPDDYIKILGVYFSAEKEASTIKLNWEPKIASMLRKINNWNKRNISMYGKVILCKTFLLSKINYIIQSLSLPDNVLAEIDRIMFKFIWQKRSSNKRAFERVNRTLMCQDISLGGLKMISVKDQQKVFHINWIKKITNEESTLRPLVDSFTKKLGGMKYIMKLHNSHTQQSVFHNFVYSDFWKKVVCTWCHLCNEVSKSIELTDDLLCKPLFFNDEIKYRSQSLYFPQWIKHNILYIHDLFQNDSFLDLKVLSNLANNYAGFIFDYNALVNSIPKKWKEKLNSMDNDSIQKAKNLSRCLSKVEKVILGWKNKDIRTAITSQKHVTRFNEQFWKRKLNFDVSKHYSIAYKATKESKLRLLHFKILHNIYPTNILLCKMKVKTNILCDKCKVPDYIEHFFVECHLITSFWDHISSYIKSTINVNIKLNTKDILLGLEYSEHNNLKKKYIDYINFIILIAKLSVSKFKYGQMKNIYLIFELELILREKFLLKYDIQY